MAQPPLWTIRDPQVRAIVRARREHEEQSRRQLSSRDAAAASAALDNWLQGRMKQGDGRAAGYTKCIHREKRKRCQRRARYFGRFAGGGLCYDHVEHPEELHAADRERFDEETKRRKQG